MDRGRRTIGFSITVLVLAAFLAVLTACTKKPSNGTNNGTPTGTVTPTPWEDDDTEPALLPAAQSIYQLQTPAQGELCAEFVIDGYGSIFVRLFSEDARKAVENFKTLSENGAYDGIPINRVVGDYMMQAGDKDGLGLSGKSIYGGGLPTRYPSAWRRSAVRCAWPIWERIPRTPYSFSSFRRRLLWCAG